MRTTYERVTLTVTKNARCSICGRKTKRSITLGQTINPWNRNADGTVRTRAEIRAALEVEGRVWQSDPDGTHDRCRLTSAATR